MSLSITRRMLNLVLVLSCTTTRADLLYQPPAGSGLDSEWQSAAAQLFTSVARLNEALAALERRNSDLAGKKLGEALGLLKEAASTYDTLSTKGRSRKIVPDKLSADGSRRWEELRKLDMQPETEQQAARIAKAQADSLRQFIEKNRELLLKSDLGTVRELLAGTARLQRIGTSVAELMRTLPP